MTFHFQTESRSYPCHTAEFKYYISSCFDSFEERARTPMKWLMNATRIINSRFHYSKSQKFPKLNYRHCHHPISLRNPDTFTIARDFQPTEHKNDKYIFLNLPFKHVLALTYDLRLFLFITTLALWMSCLDFILWLFPWNNTHKVYISIWTLLFLSGQLYYSPFYVVF